MITLKTNPNVVNFTLERWGLGNSFTNVLYDRKSKNILISVEQATVTILRENLDELIDALADISTLIDNEKEINDCTQANTRSY